MHLVYVWCAVFLPSVCKKWWVGVEEKQNSITSIVCKSKQFGTLVLKLVQHTTDALHLGIQTEECNLEHSSFLCSSLAESRPSIVVRSLLCDCLLRSNVLHLRVPNQLHPPCVFNLMFPLSANCLSSFRVFIQPRLSLPCVPFMFVPKSAFCFILCLWSIVASGFWIFLASLSFLAYILTAHLSTNHSDILCFWKGTKKTLSHRCTRLKTVESKAVCVSTKKAEQMTKY